MQHRSTDTEQDLTEIENRKRLFRFDPKIDSGNILQIVVLIGGMAVGYSKIEKSIALNEQKTGQIEQRAVEQEQRTNAALANVTTEVKATGQQVQDLKLKIELLDMKVSQTRAAR
jgi:hypothetical protein